MNKHKLLKKAISRPNNLNFREFVALIEAFGFTLDRTSGSHQIFEHPDVPEVVNVQSVKGKAKPYQVREFLGKVERFNLKLEDDE